MEKVAERMYISIDA